MRKGGFVMEYGKDQLKSFISDSQAAFMNGQLQQAFSLAKETIKLDENCADAYQCAAKEAIGRNGSKAPIGYTWHHIEDGEHMLLVSTDVHSNFPHTSGASIARNSL